MPNKENEKRFVLPLIILSAVAVIILHSVFWPEFIVLFAKDSLFQWFHLLGMSGYGVLSYFAWKWRNNPNKDITRWGVVLLAAFICIWIGTWCAQYRADKADGIEYKYDKP